MQQPANATDQTGAQPTAAAPEQTLPSVAQPQPVTITQLQTQPVRTAETERARIVAILGLPEAQGREAVARTLIETDLDAEACRRILAATPAAASAPAPVNRLEAAMATIPNPHVGTGQIDNDSPQAEAERILAWVPQTNRRARVAKAN